MFDAQRLKKLQVFQNEIGYYFKNLQLLNYAFTHKSLSYELDKPVGHNERMEFLGDAILELIICSFLYRTFPNYADGQLTKLKSVAVSQKSLSACARDLNISKYLALGQSEASRGGENRESLLADSFEALVAAIYLDGGLQASETFVLKSLRHKVLEIDQNKHKYDYKTLLQEEWQSRSQGQPSYKVLLTTGPEHAKEFKVEVNLSGKSFGIGLGRSKKEAEQNAAAEALERLHKSDSK